MKVVKCQKCGKEFEVEKATGIKYCDDCKKEMHEESIKKFKQKKFQQKQEKLLTGIEGVDYVIDHWNGLATKTIGGKWMEFQHPGRTLEEYKQEFPDAQLVCESTSKKISENSERFMNTPEMKKMYSKRICGDKNPNAKCNTTEEQRKSVSPFSKSFKNYDGLTDEEKHSQIIKCLRSDEIGRNTNQVEYWIKKGYSEEEAKEKVSQRQRTFTLEKCIEKYGLEDGYNRWKERQEIWSQQMETKYKNGEFSKAPHTINSLVFSKIEKEFIDHLLESKIFSLSEIYCYKTHQMELLNESSNRCKNRRFLYDFSYKNKIIEFNGDFWHMNPDLYKGDYYNKISKIIAKDKWEIDKIKIECAEQHNYKVLVIWESEYNKNKEGVIQKCLDFLTKE